MFKKYLTACLIFAPIVCLARHVEDLEDGPSVGYVFGGDVEDEGFAFGYQVGYEVNDKLSFEFAGNWHEDQSVRLNDRLPTVPAGSVIDLDVFALALTGRLGTRPDPSVLTYIGGGFGYYFLDVGNEDVRRAASSTAGFIEADAEQQFGVHYVVGAEVILTEHWEIFAEFRQIFLDTDIEVSFAPNRDTPATSTEDEFSYDHLLVRIGVNYRF
jgi:opacity protein-like surface antigen